MTRRHQWIQSSDVQSLFPTFIWKFELTSEAQGAVNGKIMEALERLRRPRAEGGNRIEGCTRSVSFKITGCWANVNPPGAPHKAHSHPNNFLSGVYYVRTQAGADTINFHDPRVQTNIIRPPVTELTAANTDQVVVKVSNGMLLVFPAYLQHSVDANESQEERISVSFNVMFSSFTENLSKPLW